MKLFQITTTESDTLEGALSLVEDIQLCFIRGFDSVDFMLLFSWGRRGKRDPLHFWDWPVSGAVAD